MANTIRPEDLGAALSETLTIYGDRVTASVDDAGKEAMKRLVSETRASAPKGARGGFQKNIASKEFKNRRGSQYVWFVKAPDYRLTHLIVHGHAKKDGGRTRANPFLQNALAAVLPEYEAKVKEAIQNGGN